MSETKTAAPPPAPTEFDGLALIEASVVSTRMGLVLLKAGARLAEARIEPAPRGRALIELVAASEADVLKIVHHLGLPRLITSSDVSERPLYWSGWVYGTEVRVPVVHGGVA